MSGVRVVAPEAGGRTRRALAAPGPARRVHRPAPAAREPARSSSRPRARGEALDHVLFFHGPPGLGKTTLAQIVARELGVGFPRHLRAGDRPGRRLAALLTNLQPRDVLFIDEIHRLNPAVEEVLYPAMEDFQLDLIIGEGPAARSVRIDLPPFTLVGATTRSGLITTPLRERFGIPLRVDFYECRRAAAPSCCAAPACWASGDDRGRAPAEIARRARGTPRVAGRLLRRVRDFAAVAGVAERRCRGRPTPPCQRLDVDDQGASTPWTGAIWPASPRTTAAGRSASRPWRRPCRSSAT